MKKLGKKRTTSSETVQAYACMCVICACKSCATAYVSSTLESGAYIAEHPCVYTVTKLFEQLQDI